MHSCLLNDDTEPIHRLQDMTLSSTTHSTSAGTRLANIPELVGAIFINLGILDLVRAQQVCRRWRDCVRNVSELQPGLYKRAMPTTSGDNPHFEELDNHNSSVQYTGFKTLSEHLNSVGSQLSRKALELIRPDGVDCKRTLDIDTPEYDVFHRHSSSQRVFRSNFLHQFGNTDQRETWPEGTASVYCNNCRFFHLEFRWHNLHPLLQFLQNTPYICVDGHGPNIRLTYVCFLTNTPDIRTQYEVFQRYIDLCEKLHCTSRVAKKSKLRKDLVIQPLCNLLESEYVQVTQQGKEIWPRCIQQKSGITLQDFLEELMVTFRTQPLLLRFDAHNALKELQDHEMDDPSCSGEEAHREKMAYTEDIVEKMNQRWRKTHVLSAHWRAQAELEGKFNYLEL